MSPSPSVQPSTTALVLACARSRIDPASRESLASLAADPQLDWNQVRTVAREHGVLPLVYAALQSLKLIPAAVIAEIKAEVQQNHFGNLQLMAELTRLTVLMRTRGIRVLPYKGPALALFAYGDLAARMAGDLDILVPRRDLSAARDVLLESSYLAELNTAAHSGAAEYHDNFLHPRRRISVELHWQVVGDLFSFQPDPDDLWDRGTDQPIAGKTLRTMSAEDTLIVLSAHGMKHFWSRLSWICDLAELIKSNPALNWTVVVDRAQSLGSLGIVLLALHVAHDLLGAAVPPEVLSRAKPHIRRQADRLSEALFAPPAAEAAGQRGALMQLSGGGLLESLLFHFRTRERFTDGFRYLALRAITPTALEHGWLKLPRWLSFLYYPLRPLRLLFKYGPAAIARAISPRRVA